MLKIKEFDNYDIIKINGIYVKVEFQDNIISFPSPIWILKQFNIKTPLSKEYLILYLKLGYECLVKTELGYCFIKLGNENENFLGFIKPLTISEIKDFRFSNHYYEHELELSCIEELIKEPWYHKYYQKIVKLLKKLKNI